MAVFEAIELDWRGKKYIIPPNKVLQAIAAMEDHITLADLSSFGERPRLANLSRAFAAALKIAGAKTVTADQVYEALFGDDREAIANAALKLMLMMLPPKARAAVAEVGGDDESGDTEGNAPAPVVH